MNRLKVLTIVFLVIFTVNILSSMIFREPIQEEKEVDLFNIEFNGGKIKTKNQFITWESLAGDKIHFYLMINDQIAEITSLELNPQGYSVTFDQIVLKFKNQGQDIKFDIINKEGHNRVDFIFNQSFTVIEKDHLIVFDSNSYLDLSDSKDYIKGYYEGFRKTIIQYDIPEFSIIDPVFSNSKIFTPIQIISMGNIVDAFLGYSKNSSESLVDDLAVTNFSDPFDFVDVKVGLDFDEIKGIRNPDFAFGSFDEFNGTHEVILWDVAEGTPASLLDQDWNISKVAGTGAFGYLNQKGDWASGVCGEAYSFILELDSDVRCLDLWLAAGNPPPKELTITQYGMNISTDLIDTFSFWLMKGGYFLSGSGAEWNDIVFFYSDGTNSTWRHESTEETSQPPPILVTMGNITSGKFLENMSISFHDDDDDTGNEIIDAFMMRTNTDQFDFRIIALDIKDRFLNSTQGDRHSYTLNNTDLTLELRNNTLEWNSTFYNQVILDMNIDNVAGLTSVNIFIQDNDTNLGNTTITTFGLDIKVNISLIADNNTDLRVIINSSFTDTFYVEIDHISVFRNITSDISTLPWNDVVGWDFTDFSIISYDLQNRFLNGSGSLNQSEWEIDKTVFLSGYLNVSFNLNLNSTINSTNWEAILNNDTSNAEYFLNYSLALDANQFDNATFFIPNELNFFNATLNATFFSVLPATATLNAFNSTHNQMVITAYYESNLWYFITNNSIGLFQINLDDFTPSTNRNISSVDFIVRLEFNNGTGLGLDSFFLYLWNIAGTTLIDSESFVTNSTGWFTSTMSFSVLDSGSYLIQVLHNSSRLGNKVLEFGVVRDTTAPSISQIIFAPSNTPPPSKTVTVFVDLIDSTVGGTQESTAESDLDIHLIGRANSKTQLVDVIQGSYSSGLWRFNVRGLPTGNSFFFRVVATDDFGNSVTGDLNEIKFGGTTAPSAGGEAGGGNGGDGDGAGIPRGIIAEERDGGLSIPVIIAVVGGAVFIISVIVLIVRFFTTRQQPQFEIAVQVIPKGKTKLKTTK